MSLLELIFALPPEIIREDRESLLKTLRDCLETQSTDRLVVNLVSGFHPAYVRRNLEFYLPFFKEIITKYNSVGKRVSSFTETVRLLD